MQRFGRRRINRKLKLTETNLATEKHIDADSKMDIVTLWKCEPVTDIRPMKKLRQKILVSSKERKSYKKHEEIK